MKRSAPDPPASPKAAVLFYSNTPQAQTSPPATIAPPSIHPSVPLFASPYPDFNVLPGLSTTHLTTFPSLPTDTPARPIIPHTTLLPMLTYILALPSLLSLPPGIAPTLHTINTLKVLQYTLSPTFQSQSSPQTHPFKKNIFRKVIMKCAELHTQTAGGASAANIDGVPTASSIVFSCLLPLLSSSTANLLGFDFVGGILKTLALYLTTFAPHWSPTDTTLRSTTYLGHLLPYIASFAKLPTNKYDANTVKLGLFMLSRTLTVIPLILTGSDTESVLSLIPLLARIRATELAVLETVHERIHEIWTLLADGERGARRLGDADGYLRGDKGWEGAQTGATLLCLQCVDSINNQLSDSSKTTTLKVVAQVVHRTIKCAALSYEFLSTDDFNAFDEVTLGIATLVTAATVSKSFEATSTPLQHLLLDLGHQFRTQLSRKLAVDAFRKYIDSAPNDFKNPLLTKLTDIVKDATTQRPQLLFATAVLSRLVIGSCQHHAAVAAALQSGLEGRVETVADVERLLAISECAGGMYAGANVGCKFEGLLGKVRGGGKEREILEAGVVARGVQFAGDKGGGLLKGEDVEGGVAMVGRVVAAIGAGAGSDNENSMYLLEASLSSFLGLLAAAPAALFTPQTLTTLATALTSLVTISLPTLSASRAPLLCLSSDLLTTSNMSLHERKMYLAQLFKLKPDQPSNYCPLVKGVSALIAAVSCSNSGPMKKSLSETLPHNFHGYLKWRMTKGEGAWDWVSDTSVTDGNVKADAALYRAVEKRKVTDGVRVSKGAASYRVGDYVIMELGGRGGGGRNVAKAVSDVLGVKEERIERLECGDDGAEFVRVSTMSKM